MSISDCYYNIQRYVRLKEQINTIITYLSNSTGEINQAKKRITNRYQINGDSTNISKKISKLNGDVNSIIYFLRSNVLVSIDSEIYNLNCQISYLEEQESKNSGV